MVISIPVKTFPINILKNSLKLTTESSNTIKSYLKILLNGITKEKKKYIN